MQFFVAPGQSIVMPLQNTCIYIIHTLWVYLASLANRASAHMAWGHYQLASKDLEEATSWFYCVMTKKNRLTLITRVFCLVCCYLALLKGHHAHSALSKLDTQFYPDEPDFREYKILCSHVKFLIVIKEYFKHSSLTDQNW
ncbi:hypothetical protein MJO28_007139 [Puccinia striiformis f. sp. tritici]|uniref:Uncharacterized protein n=1 Tax=Puccinia striiformis f. sp. tritici TaxID=168172 RepID=A0ACC0EEC9_9BASI|nr:hypothetical protein MJO28_007139 [Puccinia striiformis f. sp. tritici]